MYLEATCRVQKEIKPRRLLRRTMVSRHEAVLQGQALALLRIFKESQAKCVIPIKIRMEKQQKKAHGPQPLKKKGAQ